MSADNGIYILVSPSDSGNEYRVSHQQCIDNINVDGKFIDGSGVDIGLYYETLYFGDSIVHDNEDDAMEEASSIYHDIMESDFPVIEYGIQHLYSDHKFPDLSVDEAERKLGLFWDSIRG